MPTLREARVAQLMSQRELAAKAGVALKTIVDIELGRVSPRFATMRRLCAALGKEPTEIEEFREAIEEKAAA